MVKLRLIRDNLMRHIKKILTFKLNILEFLFNFQQIISRNIFSCNNQELIYFLLLIIENLPMLTVIISMMLSRLYH